MPPSSGGGGGGGGDLTRLFAFRIAGSFIQPDGSPPGGGGSGGGGGGGKERSDSDFLCLDL
jgi:hypothetical protein